MVAQIIAKNKVSHSIAESSIKESCCAIVQSMFGPEFEVEVKKIPLADNTIGRRIKDMSDNIEQQMTAIFQTNSVQFALQVDESTDVARLAQLMVFIRFIHNDKITEEFFCCLELLRTRGEDVFQALNNFMEENNMSWLNCVGICTDGAPSMLGTVKGFTTLARKKNENIIITQCFLHREALIAQTVRNDLRRVMNEVILIVNYIKSKPLKLKLFHQICEEMSAHFKTLLLHTQVRWLSKGHMLSRVFD